ncbi:MAG: DNA methyltransferase, partial [Phycisphaerae bacterium]|nr:DNA methyltransferase [Phycisphaerae bacterium]
MPKPHRKPKTTLEPRIFEQAEVSHPAGLDGRFRRVVGEFWTARQKQMNPLHYVISYRASFKPELPAYFIDRLCPPGGVVYDPFAGRGTTPLQANLMGRPAAGSDINPLAVRMTAAKCRPVPLAAIEQRLAAVDWDATPDLDNEPVEDLRPFYHARTLRQLLNLREFLGNSKGSGVGDRGSGKKATHSEQTPTPGPQPPVPDIDRFIELVALSRLHGHSDGFFSVYSFPQISIPANAQRRINRQRSQKPEFRPVAERILRKARHALAETDIDALNGVSRANRFFVAGADATADLPDGSVDLIVTSPPFLAKANYLADNWLEFWFAGIDPAPLVKTLIQTPSLAVWRTFMAGAISQMARALKPGGHA